MDRLDEIRKEFSVDLERARSRIVQLNGVIPQLEKEREQLVGMVSVMERVLAIDKEKKDGPYEPKDNGHEPNGTEK